MKWFGYLIIPLVLSLVKNGETIQHQCPPLMVPAKTGVCIDQFEWPNKPGIKPRLGLSGVVEDYDKNKKKAWDAENLCRSVGKRVCNADEWIAACEGANHTTYPFGNEVPEFVPGDGTGLCNYDKKYRNVNEYKVFIRDSKHMRFLNQSEPAGKRKTCRSTAGAYDMMGNAEEWVKCDHGTEGWCLASRFWAEPRSCRSMVQSHSPRWHYYTTGTRCCLTVSKKEK